MPLVSSSTALPSATVCELLTQSDGAVHVIAPVDIGVKIKVVIRSQRVHPDTAREQAASW